MRKAGWIVAVVALSMPARSAYALPPVTLSARTLLHGGKLTVSGSGCRQSGLGYGYAVSFENGYRTRHAGDGDEVGADGRWSTSYVFDATYPAGKYVVHAVCFDKLPNNPYPTTSFVLKPGRSPKIHGSLRASHATGYPGDQVELTGRGFEIWKAGVFLMPGQRYLGSLALPDAETKESYGIVTLPRDLKPGRHRLIAQGVRSGGPNGWQLYTLSTTVTVPAPEPAAPPAPPARPAAPPATPSRPPAPPAATVSPTAVATVSPVVTPAPTESAEPVASPVVIEDAVPWRAVGAGVLAAVVAGVTVSYVRRRRRG